MHKCKGPLHDWIDICNQFTPVIPSLRLHTSQDIGNTTETDKEETKQLNFNFSGTIIFLNLVFGLNERSSLDLYFTPLTIAFILTGLKFSESMLKNSESKITPADVFRDSFIVYPEFITSVEESNIVMEVDPHLTRQVYEKDHWDDVR